MTTDETMHLSGAELLDSDLRAALGAIPSFEVSATTLGRIRQEIVAQPVPAPPAPGIVMEEWFIEGVDGRKVRVLIFTPTRKRRPGALLWIHGGGMIMAAPDGNAPLCRYLAHVTGSVVVAVQYRPAPEHPHPAGLDDCYEVLRWMGAAGHEFGYPTDQLSVAGESGGGCLAAGVALLARDRGEFGPVGQVSYSTLCSMIEPARLQTPTRYPIQANLYGRVRATALRGQRCLAKRPACPPCRPMPHQRVRKSFLGLPTPRSSSVISISFSEMRYATRPSLPPVRFPCHCMSIPEPIMTL